MCKEESVEVEREGGHSVLLSMPVPVASYYHGYHAGMFAHSTLTSCVVVLVVNIYCISFFNRQQRRSIVQSCLRKKLHCKCVRHNVIEYGAS